VKVSNFLFYTFIIGLIVVDNFVLRKVLGQGGLSSLLVYLIIFGVGFVVFIGVFGQIRKELAATMKKVKEICSQCSASSVEYTLEYEHWGGCNSVSMHMCM